MITSIVIEGTPKILMNGSNKLTVEGTQIDIHKDIPVIRYRNEMNSLEKVQETLQYAAEITKIFDKSVHLFEMFVSPELSAMVHAIDASGLKIAKFVYWNITDDMCSDIHGSVNNVMLALGEVCCSIDQFILYDSTLMLDMNMFKEFVFELMKASSKSNEDFFGLCNSPFSCTQYACLTAVKARTLQGKYCDGYDVPLPTSSHEGGQLCSCIRSLTINTDLVGDAIVRKESTKAEKSGSDKPKSEKKASTSKKTAIPYGAMY